MQFQQELDPSWNISDYTEQQVNIANQSYSFPFAVVNNQIFSSDELKRLDYPTTFQSSNPKLVEICLANPAEVYILGTGVKQQWLSHELLTQLERQSIALNCMNTSAALRTFIILKQEKRNLFALFY